ncbi:hypothetical protein YPPY16_1529, partial [Yersinia pestis PY-16]
MPNYRILRFGGA